MCNQVASGTLAITGLFLAHCFVLASCNSSFRVGVNPVSNKLIPDIFAGREICEGKSSPEETGQIQ